MAEQQNNSVIVEVEDKLLNTMMTMMTELHHLDFVGEDEEPRTIHRVLHSIRDKHSENYDPKIISIGPLHAGKKTLEPMESLKWRFLQDLLHRCHQNDRDMLENYINKVRELEARARKRYAEVIELDRNAFVQTMVLDACFIIEMLIQRKYGPKRRHRAHEVQWCLPLLVNDLLLLENQIPFFIVQSLFEMSNIPGLIDLENLAISCVTWGKSETVPATVDPESVHHLLHLYQLSFLPTSTQMITTAPSCGHIVMNTIKKIGGVASGSLIRLFSSFLYCRLPLKRSKCHQQQLTYEERFESSKMIPSATELEEYGVELKRKKTASSLLDVTFRDGVMEIPFLTVDDNTAPLFRNLIAFEQCCPTSGSHFTSYAILLDYLINTPKDVAILEKCGVIETMLGRDEEVADLFSSLTKGACLNCKTRNLEQLFRDVNQYREVNRHRWRARLMRDYFGSPWSTISVIAAIVLLILTVVQAIYAILAYQKPPK